MEQLTSTMQQNSENTKQANTLGVSASDIASTGVTVVGQVISTIKDINESSSRIVAIITVIDNIAVQTNILAVNALVEAARNGNQGRDFAVVAVEVRSLAQGAAAAAEIKKMIADSVEKVEDATNLVAQTGLTMKGIISSVHGVTAMMSEINDASIEQTSGIEQVNQAVARMDDANQQNAALVEQAAAAAESLKEKLQNLWITVGGFKADDNSDSIVTCAVAVKTWQGQNQKPTLNASKDKKRHTLKDSATLIADKPKIPSFVIDWEGF
jgi:methyl-accepting chemotaxis protein